MPCSTLDHFPTIQEITSFKMPGKTIPIDGISLLPLINGEIEKRPSPIPFGSYWFPNDATHGSLCLALVDNNFNLLTSLSKEGDEDLLYDLAKDRSEINNIIKDYSEIVAEMKQTLKKWIASCKDSHSGSDFKTKK